MNAHTWDRANRLLSMGGHSYTYDGNGNRVSQTVSSITTRYLLDLQPGLALVIGETIGANTTRYIHAPRGIHASESAVGVWTYPMQDGLGSVRGNVDVHNAVLSSVNYSPYGVPDVSMTGFAFTGEQRDGTGVQYHRARYTNPALGTFLSLDPFEGMVERAMSLNGYGWVEGRVVNAVDASGLTCDLIVDTLRVGSIGGLIGKLNEGIPLQLSRYRLPQNVRLTNTCPDLDTIWILVTSAFGVCRSTGLNADPISGNDQIINYYEEQIRMLLNGINLQQVNSTTLPTLCPAAFVQEPCHENGRITRSHAYMTAIRQCFPALISPCGNWAGDAFLTGVYPEIIEPEFGQATRYITMGFRGDASIVTGVGSGVDINFEYHCTLTSGANSLPQLQCGWFANLSNEAGIFPAAGANVGVVLGYISFPDEVGSTSRFGTVGGAVPVGIPLEGDFTLTPSGEQVAFIGTGISSSPIPVQGYIAGGSTIYLGPDLSNVPSEVWNQLLIILLEAGIEALGIYSVQ